MNAALLLELFNGVWMISAISLAGICGAYLIHEYRARFLGWPVMKSRKHITRGMRVASALFVLSVGIGMRSATVFFWRFGSGDLPLLGNLSQIWLLGGALVSIAGFMCAIREMSKPLYGNVPWMLTLLATGVLVAADIVLHYM